MAAVVVLGSHSEAQTTDPAGGGAAHENAQPYLGLSPLIRLSGADAGEIKFFGGLFEPPGWAYADGRLLDQNDPANDDLFGVIGTTYGSALDAFALPDLRGRTPVGIGTGSGLSARSLGDVFGERSVALSLDELPAHSHPFSGGTTDPSGGGQGHENVSPSLGLNLGVVTTGGLDALGRIKITAGSTLPGDQMAADGALLDKTVFSALYGVIGDSFGSTTSHFALPDLRSRGAVGQGQGVGLSDRQIGDSFGFESISLTEGEVPSHLHSLPGGGDTGTAGGGAGHENMGPSLTLTYIISNGGSFPSPGGSSDVDGTFWGEISLFAGVTPPAGWLEADGSLLSIAANTALFSLLGITYGGDGETSFGLPDLRGRVPFGVGNGPGLSDIATAEKGGAESVMLNESQLAAHSHGIPEPSAIVMVLLGVAVLGSIRRR